MEFEAVDFAVLLSRRRRWRNRRVGLDICGLGCWCRVAVENRAGSRMREAPAPSSGFDNDAPGSRAQSVEDIAVVGCIYNLCPVRQTRSPKLRRWGEDMHESGCGCFDCFFGPCCFLFSFWPVFVYNCIGSTLPLFSFSFPSFPTSGTGVDL